MKNTFCVLFLALSILLFCAHGVIVVINAPPGAVVRVRSGTTQNAPGIATLPYGTFDVDCQTVGETIASPVGTSSNVWYHLPIYNGYVAGVYVQVPAGQSIPACGAPPTPPTTPPVTPPNVPVVGIVAPPMTPPNVPVLADVQPPATPPPTPTITPPNIAVLSAPIGGLTSP